MVVKGDVVGAGAGQESVPDLASRRPTRSSDEVPRFEPFGPTSRHRQVLGALVVMAGALPVAVIATSRYGRPPYLYVVLIAIGVTGMVGWLVDGRRYLGAASAALALGAAFTIGAETALDQYGLLFGLLGLALLLVSQVNPAALPGSGALLVFVAWSALGVRRAGDTPIAQAWVFVVVMLVWGGTFLRRTLREDARGPAGVTASSPTASEI